MTQVIWTQSIPDGVMEGIGRARDVWLVIQGVTRFFANGLGIELGIQPASLGLVASIPTIA